MRLRDRFIDYTFIMETWKLTCSSLNVTNVFLYHFTATSKEEDLCCQVTVYVMHVCC